VQAAGLGVHQLRYLATWGADADSALASHGHSYLGLAGPLVVLLVTGSFGLFLARLARGGEPGRSGRPTFGRLWVLAALALLAIYATQELLEGAFASGHPAGLAGVFGAGGWTALPLAFCFGLVVALLLRGAEAALARAAARRLARPIAKGLPLSARLDLGVRLRAQVGLARHLASRAPPLLAG